MTHRRFGLWAGLLLSLSATGAHALVLAINDGATYKGGDSAKTRYAVLAADLSKLLKEPVEIEVVEDYKVLQQGLSAGKYDLAMVHPAHLAMGAIKNAGYHLVAVTKGYQDYKVSFLVKPDSPLKSISELKGRSMGSPAEDSVTAWITRASLREAHVEPGQVTFQYTRFQDAVPYFVDTAQAQVGVTSSPEVVKAWKAKGGKVLAESRAVPVKEVIAGGKLSQAQFSAVQQYLLGLDSSDEGRKKLDGLKVAGYARYDEAKLMALATWLGV